MKFTRMIALFMIAAALVWFIWTWGFCRVYVEPDQMAIITAKVGEELPTGQILANNKQQGIRADVLGEGRYFLNPILYDVEKRRVIEIKPGQVGIVTSKIGTELPEGEFLANDNEKGIWRKILGPGKYRMNPLGYQIEIVDAVNIPIGYAGVITSLSGKHTAGGEFAKQDEKGVRKDILQPGLYFINPKQYKIDVLEIGVNQVSLLGKTGGAVITKTQIGTQNEAMQKLQDNTLQEQRKKRSSYFKQNMAEYEQQGAQMPAAAQQARQQLAQGIPQNATIIMLPQFVEFPSRDGFQISLDMTVEVELLPSDIAWIFRKYGDLPAVVDKIIMPQIMSISRNKGSEYGAKDFIVGEGREKFQNELTKALASTLGQKKVIVHNALIRHVDVPSEILEPIQQASIAKEENLTNLEKQNTAKKLAQLNTEQSLIEQKRQEVAQDTKKIKAEIKADQEKQMAEIKADAIKQVAEIAKETAGIDADTMRRLAEAEATAVKLVEGEKANGLKMMTTAFKDPVAYNLAKFAESLSRDMNINIIHTGEGTLWTDLEKAGIEQLGGAVQIKNLQKQQK